MANKKYLAPVKLKMLITIVNRNKIDFYENILKSYNASEIDVMYGNGLARKQILAYLGLDKSEKAVIVSIVNENRASEILNSFEDKYFKLKDSSGIAFTIPFSQMVGKKAYQFLCNMED